MGVDITVKKHHFPECAECFSAKILADQFYKKLEKNAQPLAVDEASISINCTMHDPIASTMKAEVSGSGLDLGGKVKPVDTYHNYIPCPGWAASIKRREELLPISQETD